MNRDFVVLPLEILRCSEGAFKVRNLKGYEVWIPHSLARTPDSAANAEWDDLEPLEFSVDVDEFLRAVPNAGTVEVALPEWLALKKELM